MIIEKTKKSIKSKIYFLKIKFKSFQKKNIKCEFLGLDSFEKNLKNKDNIVVVCSGPSAKKLVSNKKDFYIVTNDSYKIIKNNNFLYYVNDGYFFRRFLANAPFNKYHKHNIYFYRKEDNLHKISFLYFNTYIKLLNNKNFLISNFDNDIPYSQTNYKDFTDTLKKYNIPLKIQNSGIFILLFGFYLAVKYQKKLKIYGLDLGIGGNVHFEKGGIVGKSITNERVKINTNIQLDIIYKTLGTRVSNYSNFKPYP